jgi:hypothetical protein
MREVTKSYMSLTLNRASCATSCYVMSYHIIPYHVMSCHTISYHVMSYHIISCNAACVTFLLNQKLERGKEECSDSLTSRLLSTSLLSPTYARACGPSVCLSICQSVCPPVCLSVPSLKGAVKDMRTTLD